MNSEPQPASEQELTKAETDIEKRMSAFERSSLRWNKAMFFVTVATALFIGFQWHEMHTSGFDTHELAVAAGKQADAAKAQADQLTNLVAQGTVQAAAAKASAEATKDIAQRALAQAVATNELAKESKRQADTARDALKSSIESFNEDRRPWVPYNTQPHSAL
jgi:hypothetical protein